ncbi:MAG TPA: DUF2339 domain-containing protein, partial [Thermoanaerobaculia bacterium]|nr:DUF2339 domain-containing protein [Thermoanaerobaculia bacterium]
IFAVFGVAGATSLWPRRDDKLQPLFRAVAATSAVLPLLFAFFTAVVPQYGARYNVLFGFLLLMAGGLAAIAMWRGPRWLHALGGLASLLTFFVWLGVSYTPQSWPWSLVWLAAFIALYLLADLRLADYSVFAAPLLFFVFIGLALREPRSEATLTGAMFALLTVTLAFAFVRTRPYVGVIAIALSSIAIMNLPSPALLYSASQAALFTLLLAIAYMTRHHALALGAIPFATAAYLAASHLTDAQQLTFGATVYALFVVYPFAVGARVKRSVAPHAAAVAASALFLVAAYAFSFDLGFIDVIGVVPVAQAVLMLGYVAQLLRFKPQPGRLSFVASAGLAFLTIAVPMQLDAAWVAIAWAVEALALAWLFTRVPHRGVLLWSGGLAGLVLGMLAVDPQFDNYASTYVIIAAAMFAAAWLAQPLRSLAATFGTIELFMLLNVSISDYYSAATGTSLARDLTYTIAWALFAIAMLVTGLVLESRGTRVAALGLLLVTVLKCFLYDLAQLGGLYRVASLFGLAVSLVLVGLMLQKFVILKRPAETAAEPAAGPPKPTTAA